MAHEQLHQPFEDLQVAIPIHFLEVRVQPRQVLLDHHCHYFLVDENAQQVAVEIKGQVDLHYLGKGPKGFFLFHAAQQSRRY